MLWESVPPRHLRQSTSEQTAATEPPAELEVSFYTDYADSASAAGPPAEPAGATAGPPAEPAGTVDGPAGPPMVEPEPESVSGPPRRGVGAEPTRDGPMVAPGLVVDGEVVTSDHSDNGVRPAGSFEPLALPSGGVPRPRPPGSPLRPPRIGIMVPVSNLARSLRLYRDQLGFTVVEVDADSAVLAHGTGRIVLRRVPRLTPASRPQVLLHVEVSDVDQVYEEMRAKGVEFLHPPQLMNPGQQVQLWAATFLDPDQHTIALSQWRGPD